MGHYAAEMFPEGKDKFNRDLELSRKRELKQSLQILREIENIISKNPIKLEDIELNEELVIYEPLKRRSKYNFDHFEHSPIIKSFFNSFNVCDSLYCLSYKDKFIVYGKQIITYFEVELRKDLETSLIQVSKPVTFDWNPTLIPIQYFQKK
jgi:hypothetical protein